MQEREALAEFEKAAGDRQSQLGQAIALLNLQPKTEGNLDRADSLLRQVEEGKADDLFGVMALYYRARIAQIHRSEPNLPEAKRLYEELIARDPKHPFAQIAVVKLAMIRINEAPAQTDRAALLHEISKTGSGLTYPPAIRDFHLALADAFGDWQLSDAESLDHLLAAFRSGALSGNILATTLVRIGEISRLQGQSSQAREFYSRLLEEFPRDSRSFTVRKRMGELP
jgi:tetratricopeptide (TPR) repeat protein